VGSIRRLQLPVELLPESDLMIMADELRKMVNSTDASKDAPGKWLLELL
jgi:hypothetical protein